MARINSTTLGRVKRLPLGESKACSFFVFFSILHFFFDKCIMSAPSSSFICCSSTLSAWRKKNWCASIDKVDGGDSGLLPICSALIYLIAQEWPVKHELLFVLQILYTRDFFSKKGCWASLSSVVCFQTYCFPPLRAFPDSKETRWNWGWALGSVPLWEKVHYCMGWSRTLLNLHPKWFHQDSHAHFTSTPVD